MKLTFGKFYILRGIFFIMNYIDIIFGGLILYGFFRGIKNGFFVEISSLAALVIGIYGAIHFSYIVADYLDEKLPWDENYLSLTAFAITFIIILLAISWLGKLLTKIASFAALGGLNRILGGVFGGLKFALLLGALLVFFHRSNNIFSFIDKETIDSSVLYNPVKDFGQEVFSWALKETENTKISF